MADIERVEFLADGTQSSWTVPRHVAGTLRCRLGAGRGGQGGPEAGAGGGVQGGMFAELTLPAHTILTLRPGTAGAHATYPTDSAGGVGGWPDGGDGYGYLTGGGGGSTEILNGLATVAIAGGGGGGGANTSSGSGRKGGDGQFGLIVDGGDGKNLTGSSKNGLGGLGGTTSAVGTGGYRNGSDGSGHTGGDGGQGTETNPNASEGGGGAGGGYYGGGGGGGSASNFNAGGGGAGSNWSDATYVSAWTGDTIDAPSGAGSDGYVVFEWEPAPFLGGWSVGMVRGRRG